MNKIQTLQDRRTLALAEHRAAEQKLREIEARLCVVREARLCGVFGPDSSPDPWILCTGLTHAESARQIAESLKPPGIMYPLTIETRDHGSDVIMRHRVTRRVVYDVVSLRGDDV